MIGLILTIAAGFFVAGIVWQHQRLLTLVSSAVLLAFGWWMVLVYMQSQWWSGVSLDLTAMIAAVILTLVFWPWRKLWKLPWVNAGSGYRDLMVLLVLLPVMAASILLWQVNGYQTDHSVVWHGFFNGDVATFTSLVHKSFFSQELATANPFAGGVLSDGTSPSLEYPTLLHASMARLFGPAQVLGWMRYLPLMTFIGIVLTVPAFFLLFDTAVPENTKPGWLGLASFWRLVLPAAIVLVVMALAWDTYIYPQSHFFLIGLWLTCAALFYRSLQLSGGIKYASLLLGSVITMALIASNAVVGTAAFGVAAAVWLSLGLDKKQRVGERIGVLLVFVIFVFLFLQLAAGEPTFGRLGFSYSAASDLLRLTPMLVLVMAGLLLSPAGSALTLSLAIMMGFTWLTFFFSNRDIVVANSSRFLYHGILLGWPLVVAPLVRLWYWLRRTLFFTTRSLGEQITGWVLLATGCVLFLLPLGSSVVQAHDNLMRQDKQVIEPQMVEALWWIEDTTEINDVFIASPTPPWSIPMMTGRGLLRAGYPEGGAYWLSIDDAVLQQLQEAFTGNKGVQSKLLNESTANYLLLSKEERAMWEPLSLEKVFDTNAVVIYRLK